jgi:hypothetical protein
MAPKVAPKNAGAEQTPTSNAAGNSSGSNEGAADTRLRPTVNDACCVLRAACCVLRAA